MFPLQDCPLKSQGCIEGIWALGWTLGLLGPWKHRNSWKGHSATSCVHSFPGRLTHKVGLPSLSECTLRPWEQGRWVIPQSPTWPRVPLGNLSWLWNKEFQVSPGQTGHHTPVTLDGHRTADSAVARHRQPSLSPHVLGIGPQDPVHSGKAACSSNSCSLFQGSVHSLIFAIWRVYRHSASSWHFYSGSHSSSKSPQMQNLAIKCSHAKPESASL